MPVRYRTNFSLEEYQRRLDQRTRQLSREASRLVQQEVKKNLPAGLGDSRNGFEALYDFEHRHPPGTAHRSIVLTSDKKVNNGWASGVRIRRGSPAEVYLGVHEAGAWIKAKTSKGMIFKWGGAWFRRQTVYIRKKAPMQKGFETAVRKMNSSYLINYLDGL